MEIPAEVITGFASAFAGMGGGAGLQSYFRRRSNERLAKLEEQLTGILGDIRHFHTKEKAQNGSLHRIEDNVQKLLIAVARIEERITKDRP